MDLSEPPFDGRCPFAEPDPPPHSGRKRGRTHYGEYLQVGRLLTLQDGPSGLKPDGGGVGHHEELTFIIVHQTFELWFKLIIADLNLVRKHLTTLLQTRGLSTTDVSGLLGRCLPLLRRVEGVLRHATEAFAVMETMHPSEFLEFRDYLIPASGFQSVQWRVIEEMLGLEDFQRTSVNGKHVYEYLFDEEKDTIERSAQQPSLCALLAALMKRVRMPSDFVEAYGRGLRELLQHREYGVLGEDRDHSAIAAAIDKQVSDMDLMLRTPHAVCGERIPPEGAEAFDASVRGALFVQSYRHEVHIAPCAELLDLLLAVETQTLVWRSRHILMVNRIIGSRPGTGGTLSGTAYLESTRRYRIFKSLWLVRKMFLKPSVLPPLQSMQSTTELLTDASPAQADRSAPPPTVAPPPTA